MDAVGRAGGPALHRVGPHPSRIRTVGRRAVDGKHRRSRALLSLVHRRRWPGPATRARTLHRRGGGGGGGPQEATPDRPAPPPGAPGGPTRGRGEFLTLFCYT